MTGTPLLEVTGLSIRTDAGRALTLGKGEKVGIVGKSGSGTSHSMRAVAGLLPSGLKADGRLRRGGTGKAVQERRALLGSARS